MKKKRIYAWDYIRVLAMLAIIVFHWNQFRYAQSIDGPNIFLMDFPGGNVAMFGVSFFFILSGASLMLTTEKGLTLWPFYKKRWLSIYPLFYTAYAFIFIYYYVIRHGDPGGTASGYIWTLLGMDGYLNEVVSTQYLVGEWFVGCIVLIYLVYPLLRLGVLKKPVVTVAVTTIIFVLLNLYYPFEMSRTHFFVMRIPEVLLGMFLCRGLYPGGQRSEAFYKPKVVVPAIVLSGAVFLVTILVPLPMHELIVSIFMGVSGFIFLLFLFESVTSLGQRFHGARGAECESPDALAEKEVVASNKFGKSGRKCVIGFVNRLIVRLSELSFAMFLLHHALIGDYMVKYAGGILSARHQYVLFAIYFVVLVVVAFVATKVSRFVVKSIGRAMTHFSFS
ncbi:MAG: acyltransferase [Lachnospiraceae bacterium]|nr:acyltransferase [Lachnospiraceae bacterium]